MKQCKISLFNTAYTITSFQSYEEYSSERPLLPNINSRKHICIYPDTDMGVFFFARLEGGVKSYEYYQALFALAHFVFFIRGLPLDSFIVKTPIGAFELREEEGVYSYVLEARKTKISSCEKCLIGCQVPVAVSVGECCVELFECEKIENCNLELLKDSRLLKSTRLPDVSLVFCPAAPIRFYYDSSHNEPEAPLYYALHIFQYLYISGRLSRAENAEFLYFKTSFRVLPLGARMIRLSLSAKHLD